MGITFHCPESGHLAALAARGTGDIIGWSAQEERKQWHPASLERFVLTPHAPHLRHALGTRR